METIKLSTPWNHNYYNQTPNGKGIFKNFHFEINNNCTDADWWIVWGDVSKNEVCNVKSGRVIYITDEVYAQRQFDYTFLKQFDIIASPRNDLQVENFIKIHEFAPWYFDKNYENIYNLEIPKKTKVLSVVCSDLTILSGHKVRYAFVNKMIGHFKDKIDVFGRGFNEIEDKYDALIDYKYSIAIENNVLENYFTEKISECFLTYTQPIYYGCPNIEKFYNANSLLKIDINDYKKSIELIEELIETDSYTKNIDYIIDSRNRFLESYHMFPAILKLIDSLESNENKTIFPKTKVVKPESFFINKNQVAKASKQLLKAIFKNE